MPLISFRGSFFRRRGRALRSPACSCSFWLTALRRPSPQPNPSFRARKGLAAGGGEQGQGPSN